ncbi:ABC transporter permease [Eubacterium sp. 1001713B170207_170306_E7]|uniref:fluoroquinolone export ABC transporter permease subunit n=1 Tax=Eubacterium sp. 1001713B170207_170306_E7 TaxID=2787097 RepID=UPI00189BD14C|nr:ABC transporter permease [Eubacterium sp. 1001713B170207_170306_E7]
MRIVGLLRGDIRQQWKYGFYALYLILTVIYAGVLSVLPPDWREAGTALIIFSDPAALGLFFMGAVILLERSQRVLESLTVSPVRPEEYIFSKVVSLSLIGTLTAAVLGMVGGSPSLPLLCIGTFTGAMLFSMVGLTAATRISTLNQFIVLTVPIELLILGPAVLWGTGYRPRMLGLHPGVAVYQLISGNPDWTALSLLLWLAAAFVMARAAYIKMTKSLGGVTL